MTNAQEFQIEHPGAFIKDELDARGWDQSDLAFIIGTSVQELNKVLSGRGSITTRWAQLFAEAFDVSPQFFTNLQVMYDLQNAAQPEPGVRIRASWLSAFPVREMIKRGWIEETEADLLDLQMMRFFNTNSVSEIPFFGGNSVIAHAAKKTSYEEITPAQLVWLHRVRVIASTMETPSYSEGKLRDALPDIRAHMNDSEDFGVIPQLLRDCGVRVVFVQPLPGSMIDGVCTWLGDQPVIGISLRLDRADNLCFVIRHEIEHVLQGDGKQEQYTHIDVFDPDRDTKGLPAEERHADSAAAEFLIPQDKLESFMARKGKWISETDVLAFAARHHIHPAVVIGQIQFRRHASGDENAYRWLRKYLTSVRDHFMKWDFLDGWGNTPNIGL